MDERHLRKTQLQESFIEVFKEQPTHYLSSPGRMEIIGNHTDHNHGFALAAAIDLDIMAAVAPNNGQTIRAVSHGVDWLIEIDLNNLEIVAEEKGSSAALIRGVAAKLVEKGYEVKGFDVYLDTKIPRGAGVSSSAAYEVLFAKIISVLFNEDKIDQFTLAEAGQYAEVNYFGKASGLLDQIAVSYGGISYIDFANISAPQVETINFELQHYDMIIVNTGGSHAKLTKFYEEIPADMKIVANFFNQQFLREVDYKSFVRSKPVLYKKFGGRPVLRAQHFFEENARVLKAVQAMKNGNENEFVRIISQSGASSLNLLQNYTFPGDDEQHLLFAYQWAKYMFRTGAYRVHGGGFAGTLLALVPKPVSERFIKAGEAYFGKENLFKVKIRQQGTSVV